MAPITTNFFLGETGPTTVGSSICFALYAADESVIKFSSRFCNSIRYRPAFTSCWRLMSAKALSLDGADDIRLVYLFCCPCNSLRCIIFCRLALWSEVRNVFRYPSASLVMTATVGLFSGTERSNFSRSRITSLYLLIIFVRFTSTSPIFVGTTCNSLRLSLQYSIRYSIRFS